MLIVDKEEMDKLLENGERRNITEVEDSQNQKQPDTVRVEKLHNGGRKNGDNNIPPLLREIIAKTAQFDTVKKTAEVFGVSHHHTQMLKHGSVGNTPSPVLKGKIDGYLEDIQREASEKLLHTLGVITTGEVSAANLKDKVFVADKLAGVIGKVRDKKGDISIGDGNQIVFYIPGQHKEEDYEVIDV